MTGGRTQPSSSPDPFESSGDTLAKLRVELEQRARDAEKLAAQIETLKAEIERLGHLVARARGDR